ncbi:MAG: hypothetical protein JWR37_5128 [Mycobacterium sp.]|nr:hypothetical protein [Mycobacterium sp.]
MHCGVGVRRQANDGVAAAHHTFEGLVNDEDQAVDAGGGPRRCRRSTGSSASSRQRVDEILGEAELDERGQGLGRIVPHGRRSENAGEGLVLDHRDGVRSKTDAAGYGQRIRRLSRLEHMPPLPTRVAP